MNNFLDNDICQVIKQTKRAGRKNNFAKRQDFVQVLKIMNISFTPKTVLYIVIFLWIVFSVVYIATDFWTDYKNVQLVQAYEQGRRDTINQLIQEAKKCEPFPIFSGGEQINLIDVNCQAEGQ